MLRSMEEKGYVERRVDEKDRRNTRVSITPDGKEAEQQVRRQMQEFITGVIERLGEERTKADSFNEQICGDHAEESEQKKGRRKTASKSCPQILAEHKGAVNAMHCFLVVQAYCDLSLSFLYIGYCRCRNRTGRN